MSATIPPPSPPVIENIEFLSTIIGDGERERQGRRASRNRVVHVHLGLFGRFGVRRHRRVDRGEARKGEGPAEVTLTAAPETLPRAVRV